MTKENWELEIKIQGKEIFSINSEDVRFSKSEENIAEISKALSSARDFVNRTTSNAACIPAKV